MGGLNCVRPVAGRGALAGRRKGPEYDPQAQYIARDGDGHAGSYRNLLALFILGGLASLDRVYHRNFSSKQCPRGWKPRLPV